MIVRSAPPRVQARAALTFSRRGGRTVLSVSRIEAPLATIRPFDLPGGGVLMQLISLGPGLCGGDRIDVDIAAEAGTRVVVTTTAATRVMSMDAPGHAEQHVILRAAGDATLEYYPCLTIPYPGSALVQTVTAEASGHARLGIVECWAMGRTARAEYLEFRSLSSRTLVSIEGVVHYGDAIQLDPTRNDVARAAVLAGSCYLASGVWTGVTLPSDGEAPALHSEPLVAFAQSSPHIAYLRVLARDGPQTDRIVRSSVELVSRSWGLVPVALDRFHS